MQKAGVGGILAIVGSALGALSGLALLAFPFLIAATEDFADYGYGTEVLGVVQVFYGVMGVGLLLVSVLGIVGGIFALRRQTWGLALAGAIASSIVFYPLGIVAVVLISMGYQEFRRTPAPAPAVPPPPAPVPPPPAV